MTIDNVGESVIGSANSSFSGRGRDRGSKTLSLEVRRPLVAL